MAQNLSKKLVDLRGRRPGAKAGSKLGLDHVKRGLDVRPLMVVREELLAVIGEKLVHPTPQLPASLSDATVSGLAAIAPSGVVVRLEGYQRKRTRANDSVEVGVADVALVGSDSLDVETLGGTSEERG
jgi:hypothetical protein